MLADAAPAGGAFPTVTLVLACLAVVAVLVVGAVWLIRRSRRTR